MGDNCVGYLVAGGAIAHVIRKFYQSSLLPLPSRIYPRGQRNFLLASLGGLERSEALNFAENVG